MTHAFKVKAFLVKQEMFCNASNCYGIVSYCTDLALQTDTSLTAKSVTLSLENIFTETLNRIGLIAVRRDRNENQNKIICPLFQIFCAWQ